MLADRVRMGSGGDDLLKPGDIIAYEDNRLVQVLGGQGVTRTKFKEVLVNGTGVVRFSADVFIEFPSGGEVELMWNHISFYNPTAPVPGTYSTVTQDIPVSPGDILSISLVTYSGGGFVNNRNFSISLSHPVSSDMFTQLS